MRLLAFILALLPATLLADPPKAVIKAPKEIKVGDFVDLDASGSEADFYEWRVVPAAFPDGRPTFRLEKDAERGKSKTCELTQAPGTYAVRLIVSNDEGPDFAEVQIVIPGPKCPDPVPCPECPAPIPCPEPIPQPIPPKPAPENEDIEEPTLVVPDVTTGAGIAVTVRARTNGKQVRFIGMTPGLTVIQTGKKTAHVSAPPGEYSLLTYTSLNDVLSDPLVSMVSVRGAQPPPKPDPKPEPPPGPAPTPTPTPTPVTFRSLEIITIDAWAARSPRLAQVLTDPSTWQGFRSQGHDVKQYDKAYIESIGSFRYPIQANGGYPILIIRDKNRVFLNDPAITNDPLSARVPDSLDGLRALIAKYAGK